MTMHVTVDAGQLRKSLAIARLTAGKPKDGNPLTACVMLIASGGCLDVVTTTALAGSQIAVPGAKTKREGQALVDFAQLVKVVEQCDLDTDLCLDTGHLAVKSGRHDWMVLAAKESEHKKFPFRDHAGFDSFTAPLAPLAEAMRLVSTAATMTHESEAKGPGLVAGEGCVRVVVASERSGCGAFLSSAPAEHKKPWQPVVLSPLFAQLVLELARGAGEGEEIEVGVQSGTASVYHRHGYTYVPLCAAKPADPDKMGKMLRLDGPGDCQAMSGMLASTLKAALVCAGEGSGGVLDGGRPGELVVRVAAEGSGKAESKMIIAGAFGAAKRYNVRLLHNYVGKVGPDEELRLHQVVGKHAAALVVRHGPHVFAVADMHNGEGDDDAGSPQPKQKRKRQVPDDDLP
jgi:hypothetical protein